MPLGSKYSHYQSRFNENVVFRNFNDTHHALVVTGAILLLHRQTLVYEWTDACSLGRLASLNRYFVLILDKGIEYWATYFCKK